MKEYVKLNDKLSGRFKNSTALDLLDHQLGMLPNRTFKSVDYKDSSYEVRKQGDKIKYDFDKKTNNINVLLETIHDDKKKFILLQILRAGNEVNIITRSPREDTEIFHVRHNSNNTVTSLFKRIKYYDREDEQLLETRYALFSDDGKIIKFDEKKTNEEFICSSKQYRI